MAMSAPEGQSGYTLPARMLHWLTAIIVIGMIPAGIYMVNASAGPTKDLLFNLHRSFGVVLLPIMLLRLTYRVLVPPPPLPKDIPPMQRLGAHATHWALYALLIIQPIVGWIATSAYRAPISVFWLFELPPIWAEDRPFSETMFFVHRMLGLTIAALVLVHIAAALYHHFVRRDDVLLRMVRG
ncbi:MAG: cytochrome b [Xanthobacteraceae bacterium]